VVAAGEGRWVNSSRVDRRLCATSFSDYRCPPEVILLAVHWYLRYGPSDRDVEELLAERGIEVDNVTIYRWLQRFTPLLIDAARPCRHGIGDQRFVDETHVKVAGVWRYVYRAVDQHGHIIDIHVSKKRDTAAARRFFDTVLGDHGLLKARRRPMRCLKRDQTASVVTRCHAFIQNLRRGHYELGITARNKHLRAAAAFDELAEAT